MAGTWSLESISRNHLKSLGRIVNSTLMALQADLRRSLCAELPVHILNDETLSIIICLGERAENVDRSSSSWHRNIVWHQPDTLAAESCFVSQDCDRHPDGTQGRHIHMTNTRYFCVFERIAVCCAHPWCFRTVWSLRPPNCCHSILNCASISRHMIHRCQKAERA